MHMTLSSESSPVIPAHQYMHALQMTDDLWSSEDRCYVCTGVISDMELCARFDERTLSESVHHTLLSVYMAIRCFQVVSARRHYAAMYISSVPALCIAVHVVHVMFLNVHYNTEECSTLSVNTALRRTVP